MNVLLLNAGSSSLKCTLMEELRPLTYRGYSFKRYDRVLARAMSRGKTIYSAAYIMPSGGSLGHERKHQNHLTLIERMIEEGLPARIAEAATMKEAFDLIRACPMIGDFLAYQYVTDVNYSEVTNFTEMEFVVPGPGAIDGIRKCFKSTGGMSDAVRRPLPRDRAIPSEILDRLRDVPRRGRHAKSPSHVQG